MRIFFSKVMSALAAFSTIFASSLAFAVYTVNIQQVGPNVVATGNGSINLSGLSFVANRGIGLGNIYPDFDFSIGVFPGGFADVYSGLSGPTSYGPGSRGFSASSSAGTAASLLVAAPQWILVPTGYVSNAALGTATSTWNSTTIAALGLTPGTFTWTWGAGPDSYVINVLAPPVAVVTPVPTLSAYVLMVLASLLAVFGMRQARRHRIESADRYLL